MPSSFRYLEVRESPTPSGRQIATPYGLQADTFQVMSERLIVPVILSGGAGTRLWPMSRPDRPKQFLNLTDDRSMLQATVDRLEGVPGLGPPVVVCAKDHAHLVRLELPDEAARLILEPMGRNTAPAAAAAALSLIADDPILLILPADHVITDTAPFKAAVLAGAKLAEEGRLVTFGVVPTYAETGYGYIRAGAAIDDSAFEVDAFVEKPDAPTAEEYLSSGNYSWNSGMFMFTAGRYLEELAAAEPEIVAAVANAVGSVDGAADIHLDSDAFASCPSDSIDFAVMEHTRSAAVIPLSAGWSDLGSWSALWDLSSRDESGNVRHGNVVMVDSTGSLAWSQGRLIAAVGAEDLVIVETDDAVLVAPRSSSQQVKDLVDTLRDSQHAEAARNTRMEVRPWGSFEILAGGDRYQVKRLVVNPGAKLSLQSHRHRAEEWTVVNGTARVTLDDDEFSVPEGGTVSVAVGARHRLQNPGRIPLVVIEVQLGSYLGEDDIERYDDEYGRS
jgi:mannose-1-phosphate guanylyltransferase/mannose-6-phosphate isomerase